MVVPILPFIVGTLVYAASVAICYLPIKHTSLYMPLGLALALAANYLWLSIARASGSPTETQTNGFVWDGIIVLTYAMIPLFFGARLNVAQSLGVGLVIAGMVLLKL
jgi:multidrug transporter EmrE-like cation transporter